MTRVAVVLLAILAVFAVTGCVANPSGAVRITEVTDGDTIRAIVGGKEESIRLIGIDTPELRPRAEPLGHAAHDYVVGSVEGKWVWLEHDRNERDRYGRLLAYVWLRNPRGTQPVNAQDDMLNARLLLAGLAEVLNVAPNDRYAVLFRGFQADAVSARRGKWQGIDTSPKVELGISIAALDLQGELATLRNGTSQAVDVSGWVLVSEVGKQRFSIPTGTVLAPLATLDVVSGSRAQSGAHRLLWTTSRIWNDDGDTAVLLNADGREVARLAKR